MPTHRILVPIIISALLLLLGAAGLILVSKHEMLQHPRRPTLEQLR
jgi:hypothetical protein